MKTVKNFEGAYYTLSGVDLKKIAESGQVFSWEERGSSYLLPIGASLFELEQLESMKVAARPLIRGADFSEEAIYFYFDAREDYEAANERISALWPELKPAIEYSGGLRLLKQDALEMMFTFTFSQNNHIPRIRKSIAALKKRYGNLIGEYEGIKMYEFPEIGVLRKLKEADYVELGAGYRAPYLLDLARKSEELIQSEIAELSSGGLIAKLMEVKGIGLKVASCIALYGFHRRDVFPIDTWVKKALVHYFGEEGLKAEFIDKLITETAEDSALMQQVMFYYMREGGGNGKATEKI